VDVSFHHNEQLVRPWRTAAFVAAAIAAVELLVLIVVGGALIAKATTATSAKPAKKAAIAETATTKTRSSAAVTAPRRAALPAARLPRGRVSVVVFNGGTRQGAAAATAAKISRRGYRIGSVGNAPSSDFTRTLVMYRKGFEGEGRRLARDLGIRIVGPLDGLRTAQLHGSHAVVIIGG
jgi:hypothetical protein